MFLSAHLTMEAYQSKHSAAQTSSHLEKRYKGEGVVMDPNTMQLQFNQDKQYRNLYSMKCVHRG